MSSEGFRKLNIEVIGEAGVGKTSLIQRFVEGTFSEDIQHTSGIQVWDRTVWRRQMNILLIIRDISFHQSTRNVCRKLFRRADAIIIVFSCGDRSTFINLDEWISHVRSSVDNKYICVVAAKSDLENREVSSADIRQYSEISGLPAYETSALEGTDLHFAFMSIVDVLLDTAIPGNSFSLRGRIPRPLFGNCACPFPWPRRRSRSNRAASTASSARRRAETQDTNRPADKELVEVTSSSAPEPVVEAGDNRNPNIPVTGVRELPSPVLLGRPTQTSPPKERDEGASSE